MPNFTGKASPSIEQTLGLVQEASLTRKLFVFDRSEGRHAHTYTD